MCHGTRCGWCLDGNHALCVVAVAMSEGLIWRCSCQAEGHPSSRCVICGRRDVPVDVRSRCVDRVDCAAHRAARPRLRRHGEAVEETEVVPAPTATPRGCICCNEPTRGGLFRPGHDSRHISALVAQVMAGETTLALARSSIADLGSTPLLNKFDRAYAKKAKDHA